MLTEALSHACRAWLPSLGCLAVLLGAGAAVTPARWRRLPAPWPWALSALVGWHLAALLVFTLGCCGLLTPIGLLTGFWAPLATLSAVGIRRGGLRTLLTGLGNLRSIRQWRGWDRVLLAVMLGYAALLAVMATAPPTKHDEFRYHLLPAKRGLIDGAFRFYATPNHQVPPHMVHQSLFVPLLAAGGPASPGVFCLLWGLLAVVFSYSYVARVSRSRGLICAAIVLVAFKNCVWWVAPNPESVGSLWCLMLFLWLMDGWHHADTGGPVCRDLATVAALLCGAAAMTRVPYLLLVIGTLAILAWRSRRSWRRMWSALAVSCALLATTYGPWLIRTHIWTGNPLGIAGLEAFGSRAYDVEAMGRRLEHIRKSNHRIPLSPVTPILAPVAWAKDTWVVKDLHLLHPFVVLALGIPVLLRRRQLDLLIVAVVVYGISAYTLPHDVRFHLFLLYGGLTVGIAYAPTGLSFLPSRSLAFAVVTLSCLPTVAGAAYYSRPFWSVLLGQKSTDEFLSVSTSLYEVYAWCNEHTPRGSRFCIAGYHQARPFYLGRIALVPEGVTLAEQPRLRDYRDRVLRFMGHHALDYVISLRPIQHATALTEVARFPNTIVEAYRTPGRKPRRADVSVYRRVEPSG